MFIFFPLNEILNRLKLNYPSAKKQIARRPIFFKQIGIFPKKGFPYEKFPY
jgi:hypothetical protein